MIRYLVAISLLLSLPAAAQQQAAPAAPTPEEMKAETQELLARQMRPFAFSRAGISGPGAEFIQRETASAQFVLLGEYHMDRDTPIFSEGLFRALRRVHGLSYLVVENDPLAIDTITARPYRGDVRRVAELVRAYPAHIGFASDQDLEFMASVAALQKGSVPTVWGIEQAQGAHRYLEQLVPLAPNAIARAEAERLLALARRESRQNPGIFLHDEPKAVEWLQALKASFAARRGSRADHLLSQLIASAEIYSYNRRASTEPVGLYNNTIREQLFKTNFMSRYRHAAKGGKLPKVLFKMGGNHMYRGKSPVQAFTIGNFAHEFAIANDMRAYGMLVLPVGGHTAGLGDFPSWYQPILPAVLPTEPVVIDLAPLKPIASKFTRQVRVEDQWRLRDTIHGFDAIVILPQSAKASFDLTGFPVR